MDNTVNAVSRMSNASRSRRLSFRETFFNQMKKSIPAIIVSVTVIVAGILLLFYNEGRAVHIAQTLDEGYNILVRVTNAEKILESNEGQLIHVTGMLSVSPALTDDHFDIEITAVRLKRRVQMYQWVEEETSFRNPSDDASESPSESSYSYSLVWRDKVVDSSSFYIPWGHENPGFVGISTLVQTADTASIGAYHLSPAAKSTFNDFVPFSGDEVPEGGQMRLHAGIYYLSDSIFHPQPGDLRAQFFYAGIAGQKMSIVGQQRDSVIHPFLTGTGEELLLLQSGVRTPEEMFSRERTQNRLTTWALRVVGWLMMLVGTAFVSHLLETLVSSSEYLTDIAALGLGSAQLTLSTSASLLIVGCAWCFYRPVWALCILAVAAVPFVVAAVQPSIARDGRELHRY